MKSLLTAAALALLPVSLLADDKTKTVPPGTPVTITVTQATPPSPPVTIALGSRHGHVNPVRQGCTHTGGGNIDVSQPGADTVIVTMSGVAVAYGSPKGCATASLQFDLEQGLEIAFDNPKVKKAKITIEGRVIGLLRSHCKGGSAEFSNATATIGCGGGLTLSMAPHAVNGGENLSVNDREGPVSSPVAPGKYTLRQTYTVTAAAPKCLLPHKAPSAEFAPDPALDLLWISYKEPFHGAAKKDFGFQVTIKVAEDSDDSSDNGKEKEKAASPR